MGVGFGFCSGFGSLFVFEVVGLNVYRYSERCMYIVLYMYKYICRDRDIDVYVYINIYI